MKKTFPLQIDVDLHKKMKHASLDADVTLHEWIIQAIRDRLEDKAVNNNDDDSRVNSGAKKAKKNRKNR